MSLRDRLCPTCRRRRPPAYFVTKTGRQRETCERCAGHRRKWTRSHHKMGTHPARPCLICEKPFTPTYHAKATCSEPCWRALQSQRLRQRTEAKIPDRLPERSPDAPYCPVCRERYGYSTNLNGALLESCRCGERLAAIKRPDNFQRYASTAKRLAELAERVATAQAPVSAKPERWSDRHEWNRRLYLLAHGKDAA